MSSGILGLSSADVAPH